MSGYRPPYPRHVADVSLCLCMNVHASDSAGGDVVVARRLAASLLAHMFLGTLPRRGPLTHPTLTDPTLAPSLAALNR
ncbi:hypothetical protein E2C01_063445 [Portunus trituberculatus]|uniref:Uncharacterized protein n=1 Tax=Portunus trituberculatus TaxID=210409 RepID=A0A5B7HIZ5_PORTR|nr:hypothetical protein [Portunus trituberculatus]